jgi:hypothetical protein
MMEPELAFLNLVQPDPMVRPGAARARGARAALAAAKEAERKGGGAALCATHV